MSSKVGIASWLALEETILNEIIPKQIQLTNLLITQFRQRVVYYDYFILDSQSARKKIIWIILSFSLIPGRIYYMTQKKTSVKTELLTKNQRRVAMCSLSIVPSHHVLLQRKQTCIPELHSSQEKFPTRSVMGNNLPVTVLHLFSLLLPGALNVISGILA